MTTIYIVTQGEYEDYHICAVFSTRELAQQYIDNFATPMHAPYEIEKYVMDDMEAVKRGKPYDVEMGRDGTVISVEHMDRKVYMSPRIRGGCGVVEWQGYAKDEQHAIKICNEYRINQIALNNI